MAACPSVDPGRVEDVLGELLGRIAGRFGRVEPRRTAERMVRGLLAKLPRKNCWTLAEYVGDGTPDAMQHLLARAVWDHDGARDDLREAVVEHLGTDGSVLVLDETGDLKKGTMTVATQRQYTGTAGRIENAQVAVYAVWATPRGAAFVDRALYVPQSWIDDPDRCAAAGLPDDLEFATKPELAVELVRSGLAAGHRPGWVTADEVYGNAPALREALEEDGVGYVLAVSCSTLVPIGPARVRADVLARSLPLASWQRRSAGAGAKGPRLYQWAYLHLDEPMPHGGRRYLLIRRNSDTGELAFYRCWAPAPTSLATLIKVAGTRWSIEDSFQSGKGLTGLDEHQVRRYPSWARWTVLVMFAHAVLAIAAAEQPDLPEEADLIPLTRNEIAHLAAVAPLAGLYPPGHHHRWSIWRRRHQHRAKNCHYQRRWARRP